MRTASIRTAASLFALLMLSLPACSSKQERAADHLVSAEEYLSSNQPREALLELRRALQLDPTNAEISYRIARTSEEMGSLPDALFYYQEAYRLAPDRSDILLPLARLQLWDDPDRAQQLIDGVMEREPENAAGHVALSEFALARGDSTAALTAALTAVELDPEGYRSWLHLGVVHTARARERRLLGEDDDEALLAEALAALERGIALMGDAAEPIWQMEGRLQRARLLAAWPARSAEAGRAFREAVQAAEGRTDLELRALRYALERARALGDIELKTWVLERMVEIRPESYRAWLGLAGLAAASGESELEILQGMREALPRHAEAQVAYARGMVRAGRHAEAVDTLETAATAVDDAPTILAGLVDLLVDAEEFAEARAVVERMSTDAPGRTETVYAEARIAFAEGRLQEAAELLWTVADSEDYTPAYRLLAQAEFRLGRPQAALVALDKAIELHADKPSIDVLRLRLRILAAAGDWRAAMRTFRRVADQNPARMSVGDLVIYVEALYETGRPGAGRRALRQLLEAQYPPPGAVLLFARHEGTQEPERARLLLEGALETQPQHRGLLEEITRLDMEAHRFETARTRLDAALAVNPHSAWLRILRARFFLGQRKLAEATTEAHRALELDPAYPGSVDLLVTLLLGQDRDEEARDLLAGQAETGTLSLSGRIALGRLEYMTGNPDRAAELLEEVLREQSDHAEAQHYLAFILVERDEQLERALELANAARATLPDSPRAANTLGLVFLRRGLPDAALAQFRDARDLARNSDMSAGTFLYNEGRALKELGKMDESRAAFEQALADGRSFPEAEAARQEVDALAAGQEADAG